MAINITDFFIQKQVNDFWPVSRHDYPVRALSAVSFYLFRTKTRLLFELKAADLLEGMEQVLQLLLIRQQPEYNLAAGTDDLAGNEYEGM